ncbi:hypothetical protein PG995_004353 [Apiospora arundinis]
MESQHFHNFDWNSPRDNGTYDLPNSLGIAQNVQPEPGTSMSVPPQQPPVLARTGYDNQTTGDTPMEDLPSVQPPSGPATRNTNARRSRYRHLDWDAQKNTIRQLYLVEDRTLDDTMEIMKNAHSFEAS